MIFVKKNPTPRCIAGAGFGIEKPCIVAGCDPETITNSPTDKTVRCRSSMASLLTQNDIRNVLMLCGSLGQREIAAMRDAGVPAFALAWPWGPRADEVIFDSPKTFVFQRDISFEEPSTRVILFPGYDEAGDLIDIVAFDPSTDRVGTWLGRAWALGAETLFRPRLGDDGALPIWRSPYHWLSAACQGLVLIRPEAAIYYLEEADPVLAEDTDHGAELRRILVRPPITILVPERVDR